jgi:hypothetical protein
MIRIWTRRRTCFLITAATLTMNYTYLSVSALSQWFSCIYHLSANVTTYLGALHLWKAWPSYTDHGYGTCILTQWRIYSKQSCRYCISTTTIKPKISSFIYYVDKIHTCLCIFGLLSIYNFDWKTEITYNVRTSHCLGYQSRVSRVT